MEWKTTLAAAASAIGLFYALVRFLKWWRPLRVSAGWKRDLVESREQITSTVTNLTDKDLVLTRCVAKPIRPLRYALSKHIRSPIASWRFRQNVWFTAQSFNFLSEESLRLPPGEQKTLTFHLNLEFPLSQFLAREFIIEVQLSNGRIFRSKRLCAPDKWLFRPSRRTL